MKEWVSLPKLLKTLYGRRESACQGTHWRSEDNLLYSVLSVHHESPTDETQVIKFGSK